MSLISHRDRELIATWVEHGIPPNRSTLEHAADLCRRLLAETDNQDRLIAELTEGDE